MELKSSIKKVWYQDWFPWFLIVFGCGFFSTVLILGSITLFVYHTDRQNEVSLAYKTKIIENQKIIISNHNIIVKYFSYIIENENQGLKNHERFFKELDEILKNEIQVIKTHDKIFLYSKEILDHERQDLINYADIIKKLEVLEKDLNEIKKNQKK